MKSIHALLDEVKQLQPPSLDSFGFDDLEYERWNGAVSQYEEMVPLIRELTLGLEQCASQMQSSLDLAREALALNERWETLVGTILKGGSL